MVESYYPISLEEALKTLEKHKRITVYAGGTDLMVVKKPVSALLFLGQVEELRRIEEDKDLIKIGAALTFTELLMDERIPEIFKRAIEHVAAPAIRNVATIGGNICNASPAGDALPVLYVLDAQIEVARRREEQIEIKRMPIEEFILGVKKTCLGDESLVVQILLPKKSIFKSEVYHYEKVGAREAQAISKLSFCGCLLKENERLVELRIAFGAVGVTVLRKREIEETYKGKSCSEVLSQKDQLLQAYEEILQPIDDQRSSAWYRKKVCLNLLDYFLETHLRD